MSEHSKPRKLKIVLLGNRAVGKSSIIRRYILDEFSPNVQSTIGVDYMSKMVTLGGKQYRLELWDTAGQEKYRSLVKGYLKNADACIYVYDTTNINSYMGLSEWISIFDNVNSGDSYCVLAGNKIDMCTKKELQELEEAKQMFKADQKRIGQFQQHFCSAKSNENIERLFEKVALKADQQNRQKQGNKETILERIYPGQMNCCKN